MWPYPSSGEKVDYGQEEAIGRFGTDPRLYGTVVTRLLPDEEGALRAVEIKAGEEVREITIGEGEWEEFQVVYGKYTPYM